MYSAQLAKYQREVVESGVTASNTPADVPTPQAEGDNGKPNPTVDSEAKPRLTIDDMIKELQSQGPEIPLIQDTNGDTWIFIDPCPQQPEQNDFEYRNWKIRCSRPHVMQKAKLLTLNSPVINSNLEPTAQFRVIRRRHLTNKLPANIKYVLDLTPPQEGDDAVWSTASLCCPEPILSWYQTKSYWQTSAQMVGGEEEYLPMRKRNRTGRTKEGDKLTFETPLAPEYCPIRHHIAIERLLATAQGLDPKLDSAVKVWTTFAVARYLESRQGPLTDYLIRWLRAPPNSYILEALPEVCLAIADHLQNYDLARDAFAILVGEEALDKLVFESQPLLNRSLSTFGRRKRELPEAMCTRVEYATQKFADRIITEFHNLASENMDWVENLPEFSQISNYRYPGLENSILDFKALLKEYVCGSLNEMLCSNWEEILNPRLPQAADHGLVPPKDVTVAWRSLSPSERIFTRIFWKSIRDCTFRGVSNFQPHASFYGELWRDSKGPKLSSRRLPWAQCREISRTELEKAIDSIQNSLTLIDVRHSWPERKFFVSAKFFTEASAYVHGVAQRILASTDQANRHEPYQIDILHTLVCSEQDEFKYLPLWAGGNDDGTNGVYNDEVPDSWLGFSTAGPGVHTGSSSRATSEYDFISSRASSAVNTSTATHAGRSQETEFEGVRSLDDSMSSAGVSIIDHNELLDDTMTEIEHHYVTSRMGVVSLEDVEPAHEIEQPASQAMDEDYDSIFVENDNEEEGDDTEDDSDTSTINGWDDVVGE